MALPEYPKDYFVRLEGEHFLDGRLTVNLLKKGFSVEISLVQKESRKIHKYVDTLSYFSDEREALDSGIQRLSRFISEVQKLSQN